MVLDMQRQSLVVETMAQQCRQQVLVEEFIALPMDALEILRVLRVDVTVSSGETEVLNGKMAMQGQVKMQVVYIPRDGQQVCSHSHLCSYEHTMEAPVTPHMRAMTFANVQQVEYELNDGRNVTVSAVIDLKCRAIGPMESQVLTDIVGEQAQVSHKDICGLQFVGQGDQQVRIREDMDLPQRMDSIAEVLDCCACATIERADVIDRQVHIEGQLLVETRYQGVSDSQSLLTVCHTLPFEALLFISGLEDGDTIMAGCRVAAVQVKAVAEETEARILCIEAQLDVWAQAYRMQEQTVVDDAYLLNASMQLEYSQHRLLTGYMQCQQDATLRMGVMLAEGMASIHQVIDVRVTPMVTSAIVHNGQLEIEGIMDAGLIYRSDEESYPLFGWSQSMSFETTLSVAGLREGMEVDIQMFAEQAACIQSRADEAELKITCRVCIQAMTTQNIQLSIDAQAAQSEQSPRSGIHIAYACPGETLWDLARRLCTTTEALIRTNPQLADGALKPGQRVMIYRRNAG